MKTCHFCTSGARYVDYKDIENLSKFLDTYGRLLNHRKSGVCARHQRALATAVKRARIMALLPFVAR
jgi:small subunit ribosomal protein S18